MNNEKRMETLRTQLALAIEFMEQTPGVPRQHSWWTGDMPASPELYDPTSWGARNYPIWSIWDDFISDLDSNGLHDRVKLAYELPIADLLACDGSEE